MTNNGNFWILFAKWIHFHLYNWSTCLTAIRFLPNFACYRWVTKRKTMLRQWCDDNCFYCHWHYFQCFAFIFFSLKMFTVIHSEKKMNRFRSQFGFNSVQYIEIKLKSEPWFQWIPIPVIGYSSNLVRPRYFQIQTISRKSFCPNKFFDPGDFLGRDFRKVLEPESILPSQLEKRARR